ncbi:MAG: hypothetical protein ACLT9P_03555 [Evtepia gabavorous]
MYLFSVGGDHSVYLGTVFGFFGLFWILVGFFFIKGGDKKAMAHFFLCGLIPVHRLHHPRVPGRPGPALWASPTWWSLTCCCSP